MLVGTTTSQYGTLRGAVVPKATLHGTIMNSAVKLAAKVQRPISVTADVYDGEYEVTPAVDAKVLGTKNKLMLDDVTVNPIEVARVSNPAGGRTIYIGGEING